MIDGLFSLIGYVSGVYAMRISRTAHLGPDARRPFGYAAEEALYATFRSLALLGLVLFGVAQAGLGISDYLISGTVEAIRLGPVAVYTAFVGSACFALAFVHHRAWQRTGRSSEILSLERTASLFDGAVTVVAGLGILATPLMADTMLAPAAPIMDSLLVLILCSISVLSYFRVFRRGVAQLAGAPASPSDQNALRRAASEALEQHGGSILDIAMI